MGNQLHGRVQNVEFSERERERSELPTHIAYTSGPQGYVRQEREMKLNMSTEERKKESGAGGIIR